MVYKKWLMKTFGLVFLLLLVFGGFNYFVDPLWTFAHSHEYNDVQEAINERQQKTNYITFRDFDYDSLLLGSSRTTYINQHDFNNHSVYNYAVSSMSIQEYNDFTQYAKKVKGDSFDTIFIGIDFFATSKSRDPENPQVYINKTNEFMYRYRFLLSTDTAGHSIKNLISSYKDELNPDFLRNYNRQNVAKVNKVSEERIKQKIEKTVKTYKKSVYGDTYQYNENYKDIMEELKKNNPNTKFVIYTTPVSAPLFSAMIEEGRLKDYKKWLEDSVSVFGEVHHFMYENSITTDNSNYYDGHHFYPEIGTMIAHKITGQEDGDIPDEFGVKLTKENLREYFNELNEKYK